MTVHWPLSPSKSTWMLPTKSGLCVEVGRVGAVRGGKTPLGPEPEYDLWSQTQILVLVLLGCVTLGRMLSLSEPQAPL